MPKQLQVTEQEKIRREKLEELKKLGINPYPAELFPVNNFSSKLIEDFEDKQEVIIAGRIMSRRIQGNASFAEIQDSKGRIQIYFNRDEICKSEDKTKYNLVYKKLLDEFSYDQEKVSKFIGKSRSYITNSLRLLSLPDEVLNLDTFFTSGPEESRAWTVRKNTPAPKAASVIHTDFEKNFIRAETVTCEDFFKYGSAEKCKENGKLRIEGKDYIVKDGDVLYFRVNP